MFFQKFYNKGFRYYRQNHRSQSSSSTPKSYGNLPADSSWWSPYNIQFPLDLLMTNSVKNYLVKPV